MNKPFKISLIFILLQSASSLIQSPPKIIKQPPTDELLFQVKTRADESDKPFIIECEADGEPAPEYSWIKDGQAFDWTYFNDRMTQQPGRGTLVIKSPRDEDLGQYQCFAKNKWGVAITNSVFVRKSELNNFKDDPPKTLTVSEGDPFGIDCEAPDGWPKPNVYWMLQGQNWLKTINSSRLTVDPRGKLWFSNVTFDDMSDDFLYACSAASYFRNEYKLGNRVHLHVLPKSDRYFSHEPVLQYVTSTNEVAYRGKELRLWCIFGGTPLPEITWNRLDGDLPKDRIMYENYRKTLVIKHVDFEDAGRYQCTASNFAGRPKTHQIQVQVHAKPRFKVEPEIQNAAEGEEVVFECVADGYPTPEIQWIHNGKHIDENSPVSSRMRVSTNKIVISGLTKEDTSNFGCNATNSLGYVYKDVYVNVLALAPEIQNPPAKQSRTVEGQSVTIHCKTFGAPKPIIKWYHEYIQVREDPRHQIDKEGNLLITETLYSDAGIYTCNATNKFGYQSASGSLIVKEKTRIVGRPQDSEAEAGSTATFRCHAEHDPSLPLRIRWFKDSSYINVQDNSRFVQSSDHSLAITRTSEMDTGTYTCLAETDLDQVEASAKLIVQDVPNAPALKWVNCASRDATVVWQPNGENKAPILAFIIQYSTSFNDGEWETATEIVPPGDTSFKVSMSPWANYTFRVIARNKVGNSAPSAASSGHRCSTPPDVPFKNPDNVEGRGTKPDNLVISWTPMRQIEHNAPGFHYKIYWKMDAPGHKWNIKELFDWKADRLAIEDQPTYQRYIIKIVAHNDLGEANVAAEEVIGYSGEDVPTERPTNLQLIDIVGPRSATLKWNPVKPSSVRGDFKGYKIQTWTEESGAEKFREVLIKAGTSESIVQSFMPNSLNYARVLAFNGAYNGPTSNTIKFRTPEGKPGPVDSLDCFPMGSSALLLAWKPPQEINGILTGYRIYYQEVTEGSELGPIQERNPRIMKDTTGKAKLAGLKPHSKYRVTIKATTRAGEGMPYYTECDTNFEATQAPSKPKFKYTVMNPDSSGKARIKITWQPHIEANPGSHFYVQYRKSEQIQYLSTQEELNEDSIVVPNLEADYNYDFRVVAVDGVFETPSDHLQIYTYSTLPDSSAAGARPIAHSGWFIGMILAILFLVLVCVIVFLIKQNRGGKYSVQEREEQQGRREPLDDGGFPEFTQPLHDRHLWSAQTSSDLKLPTESDSDSINDYAGGKIAGRFDEDGSFIGQYGTLQRRQQEQLLQKQMQQQELGIKQGGGTYV